MRRLLNPTLFRLSKYPAILLASAAITPDPDQPDDKNKVVKRRVTVRRIQKKAKKKKTQIEKPSAVERIEGNYQNRIRQHSTPEKIFSTFASKTNKLNGKQYMSYEDFRRAILPYDYRSKSAELKFNPPAFLKKLIDNIVDPSDPGAEEGCITLPEFLFITTLLAIPPSDFELAFKIFDADGNGAMSANEFIALMKHFQSPTTSAYQIEIVRKSLMWQSLFGTTENTELSLEQFSKFLLELRNAMLVVEFERFSGSVLKTMDARNFAMSLVSYAHHSRLPWYVARINRIPEGCFEDVTFEQFVDFNMCLYSIRDIVRALKFYGGCKEEITLSAFRHMVSCITGITLPSNVLDIVFWVFDEDGDNTLDYSEIDSLMSERFAYGQKTDRVFGVRYLECFAGCFRK